MTGDLTPGGIPRAGEGQEPTVWRGPDKPSPLSRRQALQRLGQGVAGGAVVGAAWLTPEILIGRPTAAGASSAAPGGGGGGDKGAAGDKGASGGTEGAVGAVGGAPSQTASPAGSPDPPPASPAGSPDPPPAAQSSSGSGGQLAFTGLNVERVLEAGAGLLVGGWILSRWSGGRDGDAADEKSTGDDPAPQ
jgi:hypothetical protein